MYLLHVCLGGAGHAGAVVHAITGYSLGIRRECSGVDVGVVYGGKSTVKVYIAEQSGYMDSDIVGVFTTFEAAAAVFGLTPDQFYDAQWRNMHFVNRGDNYDLDRFKYGCAAVYIFEVDELTHEPESFTPLSS